MPIETKCRICGATIFPTAEDIRRGPHVWRLCARCRPIEAEHPYQAAEKKDIA
jgi:hypothetical protein